MPMNRNMKCLPFGLRRAEKLKMTLCRRHPQRTHSRSIPDPCSGVVVAAWMPSLWRVSQTGADSAMDVERSCTHYRNAFNGSGVLKRPTNYGGPG
jgi:hypothetical protein